MNKVLNFHFVNDIDWFDKIICLLKSNHKMVSIDTLNQYYDGTISLKNCYHITVDDGDKSFYEIIYPVLKKYNIPATLYVSPKIFKEKINYWFQEAESYDPVKLMPIVSEILGISVDKLHSFPIATVLKTLEIEKINQVLKIYRDQTNTPLKAYQNMTIEQLKEVDESGLVTIGAHTINHPVLKNEDNKSSKYEIEASVKELAELLNHEIKYFSYPNGIPHVDFTDREQETLRNNRIQLCFSTEAKNFLATNNRLSIPRIGISNSESLLFLKAKLFMGSFWDLLKKYKKTGEYANRAELNRLISSKNNIKTYE